MGIGLISYPLYLWHLPLLAFARILVGSEPPAEVRAALLAASVALAALTFVSIEWPLRFGVHATIKTALLCVLMLVVGAPDWMTGYAGLALPLYRETHPSERSRRSR